jgi:hypothetical protein
MEIFREYVHINACRQNIDGDLARPEEPDKIVIHGRAKAKHQLSCKIE